MKTIETIRICNPDKEGEFLIINKSDFKEGDVLFDVPEQPVKPEETNDDTPVAADINSTIKQGDVLFAVAGLFAGEGVPSDFAFVDTDNNETDVPAFDISEDGALYVSDRSKLDFRKASQIDLLIAAKLDGNKDVIKPLTVNLVKGG